MRRFFLPTDEILKDNPTIIGSEAHHVIHVLRYRPGDRIGVLDGAGNEGEAIISHISSDTAELSMVCRHESSTESPIRIIVAQALLKESKMDTILRQVIELGSAIWMPFLSDRSVPVLQGRQLVKRKERWDSIAREALKQCRRTILPEILAPLSFDQMMAACHKDCDLKIVFWENETRPCPFDMPLKAGSTIAIVFGPEGGFSPSEIENLKDNGFITASLGPRILRAETACVVGCALVQYMFGDMGQIIVDKKSKID
jgi:16S rRNA (uracil1498-N3)-methyltransferase